MRGVDARGAGDERAPRSFGPQLVRTGVRPARAACGPEQHDEQPHEHGGALAAGRLVTKINAVDAPPTAPQKNLVAVGPSERPPASAKLFARQCSFAQVIGSLHWSFVLGPVGASKKPPRRSPHRPW
jgi:hypothetical protein